MCHHKRIQMYTELYHQKKHLKNCIESCSYQYYLVELAHSLYEIEQNYILSLKNMEQNKNLTETNHIEI